MAEFHTGEESMLLYRLSAAALIVGLSWGSVACTSGHEAKGKEMSAVSEAAVHPRFELTSVDTAPFPSNAFTVSDPSHLTGRRVNLPHPDCSVRRSDCEDIAHLNELDGFNLLPRLSIPFDGDIDPASVSSSTVFLLALGDATATHTRGGDPLRPRLGSSASIRSYGTLRRRPSTSNRTNCSISTPRMLSSSLEASGAAPARTSKQAKRSADSRRQRG